MADLGFVGESNYETTPQHGVDVLDVAYAKDITTNPIGGVDTYLIVVSGGGAKTYGFAVGG